jgi:small subunit ribosomal protein S4
MDSLLRNFKDQAKSLIAATTRQAEKEKNQLINKLHNMGLVKRTARLDDVLGLSVRDIMDRRLQTIIYKKGFARTINQARQFVVHKHVKVGDKKINSPSHVVLKGEEGKIMFSEWSNLSNPEHAERQIKTQKTKKKVKKIAKNKK